MYNEGQLHQSCRCGGEMIIHMHTLIYKGKVKITNVPVFMCQSCFQYKPHPAVKNDLSRLIQELGGNPKRSRFSFTEHNEWASVVNDTFNDNGGRVEVLEQAVQQALSERIDLLLDLFRIASEAADKKWMEELEDRLLRLVPHTVSRIV
ncbi:hypothetical protein G5B47_13080 [Paenibacillus sp. 7124]|uniref:YgiT-type zinc finger domain-containing protein n=1 Tax=Paenibacillus apii TaxID=1850370 RepID=A0A6M1PJG9_9BACL|nr:hypothetical protein [Paenibacillus apii]NGM83350.1 hypothetical protein [Paenibacillus apii]NJJ38999.1 hypothetical protein [Paenibacillus apii]